MWKRTGDTVTLLASLDMNGVTETGLFLRGSGHILRPNAAMMFQLEVHRPGDKRSGGQMARVCWNPTSSHTNPNKGPRDLRMIEIDGSHYHDFHLNIKASGLEMATENLNIARPITPELLTYQDFVAFCGQAFSIDNLDQISAPKWENDLFGGMT